MGQSIGKRIGLGDRVRHEGRAWTVIALPSGLVDLADESGRRISRTVHQLAGSDEFEVLTQRPYPRTPDAMPRETTADDSVAWAKWWEGHLTEVITGVPPGGTGVLQPRPCYNPAVHDLAEREAAKAAELTEMGVAAASARTVRRKRQRYQAEGWTGLIDKRTKRTPTPGARTDPRVLECLLLVLSAHETTSAHSMSFYRERTLQVLKGRYGGDETWLPSRATFYRLLKQLSAAHADPEDRDNLSRDGRPATIAGGTWLSRPGQRMIVGSLEIQLPFTKQWLGLTVALDELTWSVCALAVDPADTTVDGLSLTARWWTARVPDAETASPKGDLAGAGSASWAGLPLILPERVAVDPAHLGRSRRFATRCRNFGVDLVPHTPMSPSTGMTKVAIFANEFLNYLRTHGGVPDASMWNEPLIQSLALEWAAHVWQHRRTPELRHIAGPEFEATPTGAYAACVARQGWVHLPLPTDNYPKLLPSRHRTIAANGISVEGRQYNSRRLDPYRSGSQGKADRSSRRYPIHTDRYDTKRAWVRHPAAWIAVPLTEEPTMPSHQLRNR
ncbi:helix-turn-helix domain-containing protein [Streptomyces sp. NPDC050418]|uniref:helix-turn-helix domain-containing protein n=1 Tax=Streptomyces sp. NPDC050418 TaxID=3365612 RepID=UPI0037A30337